MANSAMPAATSAITPERQHDALFTETYRTHAPFVRRVVRANLNDGHQHLADDLMQETFLRIYRQHVRLDEVRHMAAFLALAARRTVLDHYKVKRNKLETAVDTGHWTFANRPMTGVGAILTRARTGHEGDSDPDMDEALRRVRQGRQLAVTR